MLKIFLLWEKDEHIDMNGQADDPYLHGVFTSVDALNNYLELKWNEFQVDTRGTVLNDLKKRINLKANQHKGYDSRQECTIWYEERFLDEANVAGGSHYF